MDKLPTANSGQALLLVLLSMAVVLTIILSILSRSVTDITITTKGEEALRAFSAAEAGVEKALIVGTSIGSTQIGDANFSANVSGMSSGSTSFSNPIGIISGESTLFWFANHDDNGNPVCNAQKPCFKGSKFKICWGKDGTFSDGPTTPAVEISVFYLATPGDNSTARIARVTADPNALRRSINNFGAPDGGVCTLGTDKYQFAKTVDLTALGVPAGSYGNENGLQYAKTRIFYNTDITHPTGIDVNFPTNGLLPSQGLRIVSSGASGEANRKIDVFQGFGEPPPVFDAAIFSPPGVSK